MDLSERTNSGTESGDQSKSFKHDPFSQDTRRFEVVCAISIDCSKLSSRLVGFAAFDKDFNRFSVAEFVDNPPLDILESLLLQLRPRYAATLLVEDRIEAKKLENVLERSGVESFNCTKKQFQSSSLEQDVGRLLHKGDSIQNHVAQFKMKSAMASLACILTEWEVSSDRKFIGRCMLEEYHIESVLRMDKAAFSALNLFPRPGEAPFMRSHRRKFHAQAVHSCKSFTLVKKIMGGLKFASRAPTSLLGFLDKCRTQLGSKRLINWISQPLVDLEKIQMRHDMVEMFLQEEDIRRTVQSTHLKKVPDLDKLITKFHRVNAGISITKSRIGLEDLVKLYDAVVESENLVYTLQSYQGARRATLERLFLNSLITCTAGFVQFKKLVEHTIDLKEAERGNYVISREFDPKFKALASTRDELLKKMEAERQQKSFKEDSLNSENIRKKQSSKVESDLLLDSSGRKGRAKDEKESVRLIEDNTLGYVFRVTKKDQAAAQGKKGRYQPIRINKAEYLFTTSELKSLCRSLESGTSQYKSLQSELAEKAIVIAATYWPVLEQLADTLASIDILCAFATVAGNAPNHYVRPTMTPGGKTVRLIESRHALVESQIQCNSFIANDITMVHSSSRMQIITGPNMGGKSTYIRQVGLVVLLNQIGCFVPCKEAELPVFKQIMCRVGASDIQLRGVSTFLSEMIEASTILRSSNEESLVIIDELGRGTSTFEGFGLAWAIAKKLAEAVKCFCLFATHFHEMGELEKEVHGVINRHAAAAASPADGKLTFLYEIRSGCSDQSYGLQVAKIANLPKEVLERAQQKADELESAEHFGVKRVIPSDNSDDSSLLTKKRLKSLLYEFYDASAERGSSTRSAVLEKLELMVR